MDPVLILIGLLGLGIMVFIHELGHFLAARACGIEVEAFALGWGPTLLRYKPGITEYRLAVFPIGGYCKMKGEQDMVDAVQKKTEYLVASPGSFYGAKPWKRIIVAFAGPLVNLLFAIIAITMIWFIGFTYESPDNRIVLAADYATGKNSNNSSLSTLDTGESPAAKAGLKTGDRIISINGIPTPNFADIRSNTAISARQELSFKILRDGQEITTQVKPILDTESGAGLIGIMPWEEPVVKKAEGAAASGGLQENDRIISVNDIPVALSVDVAKVIQSAQGQMTFLVQRAGQNLSLGISPDYTAEKIPYIKVSYKGVTYHTPAMDIFTATQYGYNQSIKTIALTIHGIGLMFQGLNPVKAIQGPKRIIELIGCGTVDGFSRSTGEGLRYFFNVLAYISIALFFGNLLPIPALDGGQILLFIWEAISRKPMKLRVIQRFQLVGAVLVIGLLLLAVYGDILSFFN